MIDDESSDFAPEDTGEGAGLSPRKGRQAFRKITRELSDDDLANPAVQRLVLDDLDRLETENEDLKHYRENYHESDKRAAVLEEKIKTTLATEIISVVCFTVGAASLGYAPSLWDSQPSGWIALTFGAVLIVGGVVAKVVKR